MSNTSNPGLVDHRLQPVLKHAPLVMIWREVADIGHGKNFLSNISAWSEIGADDFSVIYDAGNVLMGIWKQDHVAITVSGGCSGFDLLEHRLWGVDPALEIVTIPPNFQETMQAMSKMGYQSVASTKTEIGEKVHMYDEDGNLYSLFNPSEQFLGSSAGRKLAVRGNKTLGTSYDRVSNLRGLVGVNLMISNMNATVDFYENVLGLNNLSKAKDTSTFDAGNIILSVHPETIKGSMKQLKKSGRLMADSLVFYVADIQQSAKGLEANGITFPKGIEKSPIGQIAYFYDPDGHFLSLWQPAPAEAKIPINYFSQLKRMLSDTSYA